MFNFDSLFSYPVYWFTPCSMNEKWETSIDTGKKSKDDSKTPNVSLKARHECSFFF